MDKTRPEDRLIFALDCSSRTEAEDFVAKLEGVVSFFKVGIILHTVTGADFVSSLIRQGKKVFLDLKYFDIGDTVRDAVKQVKDMGASFLTVHANSEVMEAAVDARGSSELKIMAVTLLTSLAGETSEEPRVKRLTTGELVLRRAQLAADAGCDGVITSGLEAASIRHHTGRKLLIVTPGIRPCGVAIDGHKRFVTPGQAIKAGADYLVVGRPIKNAPDPAKAAREILGEMERAFDSRNDNHVTT